MQGKKSMKFIVETAPKNKKEMIKDQTFFSCGCFGGKAGTDGP